MFCYNFTSIYKLLYVAEFGFLCQEYVSVCDYTFKMCNFRGEKS